MIDGWLVFIQSGINIVFLSIGYVFGRLWRIKDARSRKWKVMRA